MSTKDLSRTVIEGGRDRYNTWRRRSSHREERADERAYLHAVEHDPSVADARSPEPRRPVRKAFRDRLAAAERWLLGQDLAEEHSLLLTDAEALAKRKLLDPDRIDQGRPVLGYRALVTSTLVLVALMRERFDAISHKTPTTLADLDRIGGKAKRMLRQLDMREQEKVRMLAHELRARAMTHLIRTYSQVRRNITYVRWDEGDAEAIAPSLWSGRRSGKSRNEIEIPVVPVGPQPGTEPGGPFAPDAPIVPTGPIGPAPSDGDGPFTS